MAWHPITSSELEETIYLSFRNKVREPTKISPNLLLHRIVFSGRKQLHSWCVDGSVAVHALSAGFLFQPQEGFCSAAQKGH